METAKKSRLISTARLKRLRVQGYCDISNRHLSDLSFGNKFAYYSCSTVLLFGIITANIPVLSVMMGIAFFGVLLPYHPFDYIYNHFLRFRLNKPKLPRRSNQLKFACSIATLWIATTIYAFYLGNMVAGYILGSSLLSVALLVATTDICIPSIIYNGIFKIKIQHQD